MHYDMPELRHTQTDTGFLKDAFEPLSGPLVLAGEDFSRGVVDL